MMNAESATVPPLPPVAAYRRVWVSWAEGLAGPRTLAPRGEYRAFLVFAPAITAEDASDAAIRSLQMLGWHHVAALPGRCLDPERVNSLPSEFHDLCEAAMAGETAIMHYQLSAAARQRLYPPL